MCTVAPYLSMVPGAVVRWVNTLTEYPYDAGLLTKLMEAEILFDDTMLVGFINE
jgi:hypothetical protein